MTVENIDLKTIGFFSLVGQAYVFKFLWSPLMDPSKTISCDAEQKAITTASAAIQRSWEAGSRKPIAAMAAGLDDGGKHRSENDRFFLACRPGLCL
jgi:hypothetical protein